LFPFFPQKQNLSSSSCMVRPYHCRVLLRPPPGTRQPADPSQWSGRTRPHPCTLPCRPPPPEKNYFQALFYIEV
jgi:hypothetical protein